MEFSRGQKSEFYCDVHEDEHVLHDGDGGYYCQDCDEESVDDIDSPNVYPYKACRICGQRKSCGSYSESLGYTAWFCENCLDENCLDE